MTSLVACDSSFMIKSLCSFRIPGVDYDFSINTTHVAMLLVSLFILIVAIIARVKINKANASDTPGMFQNIIELVIEMLGSMVDGIMGRNANRFVNYITTLFIFIIISNISGLFGLRPPTADYGVTLALGSDYICTGYSLTVLKRITLGTLQHCFSQYGFYSQLI